MSTSTKLVLSYDQARDIAALIGITTPVRLMLVKPENHVWYLQSGGDGYYLKAFTKSWYGTDIAGTAYHVDHEEGAYKRLASQGLPTVEVALSSRTCDNPLGRPFILTRKASGDTLMALLEHAGDREFRALLEATGDYLRRMHALTFAYPGYVTADEPSGPLAEGAWRHTCWTAQQMQRHAFKVLDADADQLTPDLSRELRRLFNMMAKELSPAFDPPRFVQANCQIDHFFLIQDGESWQVTASIDMEAASAGDSLYDLVLLAAQLAASYPSGTRWWEPLFAGYGCEPDFSLFRLRMLGLDPINFTGFGAERWPRSRQDILSQLFLARDWPELFAT